MIMDQRLMRNMTAIDIATATQDSVILLEDGTVMSFGYNSMGLLRRKKEAFTLDESDLASYSTAVFHQASTGRFSSVYAYRAMMAALTSSGQLYLWGKADESLVSYFDIEYTSLPNLGTEFGSVRYVSLKLFGFCAVVSNGTSYTFINANYTQSSTVYPADEHVQYTVVSTDNELLSTIRQLVCRQEFCLILTNDNIYGFGTAPATFSGFGPTGTLDDLSPLQLVGLERENIAKISLTRESMYVLYNDGTLWTMCGLDVMALCREVNYVAPILPQYTFLDIFSTSTDSEEPFRFALVAPNKRGLSQDLSTPFLHLLFGSITFLSNYQAYPVNPDAKLFSRIYLMPQGHPIQSPTATNITFGGFTGALLDGFLSDADPDTLRSFRWGAAGSASSVNSFSVFPSYLPRVLQTRNLIKIAPVLYDFVYLYDNCSIVTLHSPDQTTFYATDFAESVASVNDTSYNYSFVMPTENIKIYPFPTTHAECLASSAMIEAAECSLIAFNRVSLQLINFWCVSRSTAGELFAFGNYDNSLYPQINCESGMYGDIDSCLVNSISTWSGMSRFVQTKLNFSDSEMGSTSIRHHAIGFQHGIVVNDDGRLAAWGLNNRGQLGNVDRNLSTTLVPVPLSGTVTKLLAFGHTSLVVMNTTIYAWGDNLFGQLGRGIGGSILPFSANPDIVSLPAGPFKDVQCALFSCYVLFDDGDLYSWGVADGMALGRPSSFTAQPHYDPFPAPATALVFPGPRRKIVEIFTTNSAAAVMVRGALDPEPPVEALPPTAAPESPPPSPMPAASICSVIAPTAGTWTCLDGQWTSIGSVTGGSVTIPGSQVVVNGNLTIRGDVTFTGLDSSITVFNGCVIVTGTLKVNLAPAELEQLSKEAGSMRSLSLISQNSSCASLSSIEVSGIKSGKSCRKLRSATTSENNFGSTRTLVAAFKVDSSPCNVTWIILGCVLGGVLLLIVIVTLVVTYSSKAKAFVRPFQARGRAKK
jgi:alpha-tubulin suppressor-like RCC1 family protein